MKRYSRIPRIGTLMMRSRFCPMMDSSAMMSAMFSRMDSRTFRRWRARSPAERSLRSASDGAYGRKMASVSRVGLPGRPSVLPEVVGGVLEHDVDAAHAVAGLEEVLNHGVVLLGLLLVAGPRLRDDPADVAHGGHQLLLDGLLQRLVGAIGNSLPAPARRPQIGDDLLPEALRRGTDDRDLLLDGLEESLVGLQLLLGVPVLDPRLVDERLGVVEVVLEERLGLLLVGEDEGLGDLLLENLEVLLVQHVLEKLEVLLAVVVGKVGLLDHVDQRLADVDRIDAIALDVVRERVVEGLHDEAGGDTGHALALRVVAQLLGVELLRLALLDDLFAVVQLELRHQIALRRRLEARQDREHRGHVERVRCHVGAEVRVADDLLVDLHLLGEAQVVGDLHDDDAIEDGLVRVVGLELLPLGLVRVGDDAGVDVDHAVTAGRGNDLLLRRGDHGVEVLGLVLEDLDELDDAAVADVQRAVQVEDAGITLAVEVELRDVLAPDQHGGVLVVRVDGRHDADADAVALGELARDDRELLVARAELLLQAEAAHRAEVALEVDAEHLLEFLAQVAGEKMERLLEHRTAVDGVDGVGLFQAALELLDQRALAGADRPHQVEHLAALLALQGRGVEVANDLADRLLDPEELVAEEVVDLERLVFVKALHARIFGIQDVLGAVPHDHVVEPTMRQLREAGTLANQLEVLQEGAAPALRLARGAIFANQLLEGGLVHRRELLSARRIVSSIRDRPDQSLPLRRSTLQRKTPSSGCRARCMGAPASGRSKPCAVTER